MGPISLTGFHCNSNSMEISFYSYTDFNITIATKFWTWQLYFRGMCKKLLCSHDGQQWNYSKAKFPSNLICKQKVVSEIHLTKMYWPLVWHYMGYLKYAHTVRIIEELNQNVILTIRHSSEQLTDYIKCYSIARLKLTIFSPTASISSLGNKSFKMTPYPTRFKCIKALISLLSK